MTDRNPEGRRHRASARSALGALLALGVATLAGACGNVTSGGYGDVEVLLSSNEVDDLGDAASSVLLASMGAPERAPGDSIVGTLTVRVRSFARRGLDDFVELTDGVQEITVSLGDPQPIEVARRPMPAGRYDAVRTFFGRIEAEIVSGLVIDGQEITGTIPVDFGTTGTFSVVTYTGFEVWEDTPTVIAIEMQSRIWLRLVNAVLRRVDLDDFRQVLRVRVRQLLSGGA